MWPYPKILAHRGGGKLAPENTIAALRCGLAHGYRAVEFDVMLARDGVPVVVHDPQLGRTVAGSGNVNDYSGAELVRMDAGAWFGPEFAGECLPLFADYARFCINHGIWMNIEIKPADGFEGDTGAVVARMTASLFEGREGAPLLSSFSTEALEAARAAAPGLARAWLIDRLPSAWEAQARALGVVAIHTNHLHLTPTLARVVKAAGFGLFCYTVNEPERARLVLDWGVDGFCTDRIDLIGADFH
ncbi:MAG: glycerophosphodiester phosphodiesterase [Pseudomonadota bacterium]